MLAIVHRELRVAARDPRLHARRLRWGVAQSAAAGAMLLFSGGGFKPSAAEWFFETFSRLALILCLLEGVRKTSDAISSEKREGTLGFLFLSTLSGADVVLGKFSGALIRSGSVLLPFLPVLALSLLLGGTTLGEFWRVALTLITALFASLSLCLLISALSRQRGVVAALAAMLIWVALPGMAGGSAGLLSPFAVLKAAGDLTFRGAPGRFWTGLLFLSLVSVLSLAAASVLAPRVWQERPKKSRAAGARSVSARRRRQLLDRNPVLWLSYAGVRSGTLTVTALVLTAAGLGSVFGISYLAGRDTAWAAFPMVASTVLSLLIWLRVAYYTASSMAEARQNGSLELLLSTPLSIREIIRGYWLGLWEGFRLPLACVVLLVIASFFIGSADYRPQGFVWTAKLGIEAVFQFGLFAAVGMWMGLKAKTRAAAVVYTLLLAGVLPWVVCFFTFLIQLVLFFRALEQTRTLLTRLRAGHHAVPLKDLLRRPPVIGGWVPPVIR